VSIKMFNNVHGGSNFVVSGVSTGSAFWIEMLGEQGGGEGPCLW